MNVSGLCLALAVLAADPHADNAVFGRLTAAGVSIGAGQPVRLPEPTMRDGLDAAAQREVVARVAGQAYPLTRLLRNSAVAPHILKQQELTDAQGDNSRVVGRQADAWFVAYGTLDRLFERDFQDRMLLPENDDDVSSRAHSLDARQLKARNVDWDTSRGDVEGYAHGALVLWKRVKVAATLHSYCTRGEDSVIVAAMVDPRFDADREFPNRWWPLSRNNTGGAETGEGTAYPGMGMYLKATRLVEPAGALLVECHLVFAEPHAWFDGANLLGSKLPAIVQSRVRNVRRELAVNPNGKR